MADFGLNKNIHLDDTVDSDGDIELIVHALGCEWIEKSDAQAIIAHLQRVFGIGENP
jgi:hypothetical protein